MNKRKQSVWFWTLTGCLWGAAIILIAHSLLSWALIASTQLITGVN